MAMAIPARAIAAARVLAGLTQTDLAQIANLGRRTVVEIEAGRTVAAGSTEAVIDALASVGVTITDKGSRIIVTREQQA